MSSDKNARKAEAERRRAKRMMPVLIVTNLVLGLAFAVALGMILLGDKLAVNSSSPRPTQALDRVGTRADALIADLHCPCPACGHSLLRQCDQHCGERLAVRKFVVQHLRSGTDPVTTLAHLKKNLGDLTTVSSAQAAWVSRHPEGQTPASSPAGEADEIPPELMQFFEDQQGNS